MMEPSTGVPAVAKGPVQPPQRNEGEPINSVVWEDPLQWDKEVYWYCLKAPVFTGGEEVKQFIQEVNDVAAVTQWPPRGHPV